MKYFMHLHALTPCQRSAAICFLARLVTLQILLVRTQFECSIDEKLVTYHYQSTNTNTMGT